MSELLQKWKVWRLRINWAVFIYEDLIKKKAHQSYQFGSTVKDLDSLEKYGTNVLSRLLGFKLEFLLGLIKSVSGTNQTYFVLFENVLQLYVAYTLQV